VWRKKVSVRSRIVYIHGERRIVITIMKSRADKTFALAARSRQTHSLPYATASRRGRLTRGDEVWRRVAPDYLVHRVIGRAINSSTRIAIVNREMRHADADRTIHKTGR